MNQYKNAQEFLLDMCSMYNYTLSELETLMWSSRILTQFSDREIINALIAHMEGPRGSFFPKYGEIRTVLGGSSNQLDLERLVRCSSPYEAPAVNDPVLRHAIFLLGGWVEVCQQMPDPIERPIDYKQYMNRAETALLQAKNHVQIHGDPKHILRGLATAPVADSSAATPTSLTYDENRTTKAGNSLMALTDFSAANAV